MLRYQFFLNNCLRQDNLAILQYKTLRRDIKYKYTLIIKNPHRICPKSSKRHI